TLFPYTTLFRSELDRAQPRGRLVEQHEAGPQGDGPGQLHEPAGAVRQGAGLLRQDVMQAERLEYLQCLGTGLAVDANPARQPEHRLQAEAPDPQLDRWDDVLQRGLAQHQLGALERPGDPGPRHRVRRFVVEPD